MKSNTNYGQQVRKNGIHHQDEKVAITATSPLSYNSPRFAKIPDEKLIDANANKFDSKLKNKNDLKKQLDLIMREAKIKKAYSPPTNEPKVIESSSIENRPNNRMISPPNQKTNKLKEQIPDKKSIPVIPEELEKKTPAWLNKKTKHQSNLLSSKNKDEKRKSKETSLKFSNHNLKTDLKSSKSLTQEWQDNSNLSINKVILEKEIVQLKFQLENALEDKNILQNRVQTLEMQLGLMNRKVDEWKQIQLSYRNNEKILKQTIVELEEKLKENRKEIPTFHIECEREVLDKKNQQISRLNEMLMINRNKVTELNNQLSREKIKNIKIIQNIENKYENIIQEKHEEIAALRVQLHEENQYKRSSESTNSNNINI